MSEQTCIIGNLACIGPDDREDEGRPGRFADNQDGYRCYDCEMSRQCIWQEYAPFYHDPNSTWNSVTLKNVGEVELTIGRGYAGGMVVAARIEKQAGSNELTPRLWFPRSEVRRILLMSDIPNLWGAS